jgi:hypothetical protein
MSLEPHQAFAQLRNASRQAPIDLMDRGSLERHAPSFDEIENALGLNQIHLPVKDRPTGEFTGLGHARTEGDTALQHSGRHKPPAMAGDLNQILTGIRAGSLKKGDDATVDQLARRIVEWQKRSLSNSGGLSAPG